MRDYRDAKAMAQSLRQALSDKSVTLTHSESLELIAKTFGLDNWNVLAAKIEAARPVAPQRIEAANPGAKTIYCSFCGKSQHDVATIVAGPDVFICNECVELCDGILFDNRLGKAITEARREHPDAPPLETAAEALKGYSVQQLETTRKTCADWLDHIGWTLGQIDAVLAGEPRTPRRPDETAKRRRGTRDPLEGMSRETMVVRQAEWRRQQAAVGERLDLLDELLRQRAASALPAS